MVSNMSMSVSVIIPTYNRGELLIRALDSVLKQKVDVGVNVNVEIEVIIVDDGSTDNTKDLITKYLQKHPEKKIQYHNFQENHGVSWARNRGMELAKGEWISFLDSDDEWSKNKLKLTFDYLLKNPSIKVVHGNEIWIRNGVRVNQMKKHQKYGGNIFSKCLPLCLISPSAVTIHRDVFKEVSVFREDFIVCEDYELWLRITSKFEVGFIDKPIIIKYGGHQDQLSRKYVAMDYYRVVAMDDFLRESSSDSSLDSDLKNLLVKEIITKSQILLNGYQKHNNIGEDYQRISQIFARSTLIEEK
ncbi:MAG: glycosyltransferase family 2 protein [Oligoflexia bacterium]|nr:glycosyltransferase family 2 protein [Oligoflexia bacterium]